MVILLKVFSLFRMVLAMARLCDSILLDPKLPSKNVSAGDNILSREICLGTMEGDIGASTNHSLGQGKSASQTIQWSIDAQKNHPAD